MAWGKLGTNTLGSSGDLVTINPIAVSKFLFLIGHFIPSGAIKVQWVFNNNSNSVYASRSKVNGGTESTSVSQTNLRVSPNANAEDDFEISYVCSILGEEKLLINFGLNTNGAGAGNASDRIELVGKFVPSPDAEITRVDALNTSGGSYDTDSNITVLGSDLTPATAESLTIQDGAVFEETDTNKHYLLDDGTWTEI